MRNMSNCGNFSDISAAQIDMGARTMPDVSLRPKNLRGGCNGTDGGELEHFCFDNDVPKRGYQFKLRSVWTATTCFSKRFLVTLAFTFISTTFFTMSAYDFYESAFGEKNKHCKIPQFWRAIVIRSLYGGFRCTSKVIRHQNYRILPCNPSECSRVSSNHDCTVYFRPFKLE